MSYRIFYLKYDNRPLNIVEADLEKFQTEEDAIEHGCSILKNYFCKTCDENHDSFVDDWKKYKYIHHDSKWHGFKLKLFIGDSYLSIFKNYFNDDDICS